MKKVTFNDLNIVFYTYSKQEYDRSNNEMDTVFLLSRDYNHQFKLQIYAELNYFKNNEMIYANNISHDTI